VPLRTYMERSVECFVLARLSLELNHVLPGETLWPIIRYRYHEALEARGVTPLPSPSLRLVRGTLKARR
jgi:hypothetical protein